MNHFAICPGIKTVECLRARAGGRLSNFAATPRQYIRCQSSPSQPQRTFSQRPSRRPHLHAPFYSVAARAAVMMQGAQSGAQECRIHVLSLCLSLCECVCEGRNFIAPRLDACSTTDGAPFTSKLTPRAAEKFSMLTSRQTFVHLITQRQKPFEHLALYICRQSFLFYF